MSKVEVKNPYQVLYFQPSMPSVVFAKMAQKYHNQKALEVLQKVSEITGYRLIPSAELNWRQRQKYSGYKFQVGYYVYYLIPASERIKGCCYGAD